MTSTAAPFRPLRFGVTGVHLRDGAPGTHYLSADQALQPFPERLADRFMRWAAEAPERTWVARRAPAVAPGAALGDWQHVSYAQGLAQARSIAQALLDRGLSAERPVVILSENSIEHALMALGCMLAWVLPEFDMRIGLLESATT